MRRIPRAGTSPHRATRSCATRCIEIVGAEIDGLILVFPACGHLQEDAVLYDTPFCVICEG